MTEVHADRSSPWPFIGISILVLLLALFLYLRMAGKKDPLIATVAPAPSSEERKEPAVVVEEGEKDVPPSDPSPKAGTGEQETPEEKHAVLMTKAREAVANRRVEEALSLVAAAREIRASEELDKLEKEIIEIQAVLAREKEERDRIAAALLEISEKWEKEWKKKNLWKTALKRLERFETEHSAARKNPGYQALRKVILEAYTEYSGAFKANVARAEKLQASGETSKALSRLRIALSLFPERAGEVNKLRAEWENVLHSRNMIRVGDAEVMIGGDGQADEKPVRAFGGKVFWIDQYEVTNGDYAAFLTSNPEHPALPAVSGWQRRKPPKGRERHPVTYVSYTDAEAYARWAKKRLPTAEEWEKAARFQKGGVWPWGDSFPPPGSDEFLANSLEYWQRYKNRVPGLMPVGSFPKGRGDLDLYDMAGNVWEWTSSKVGRKQDGKGTEMVVLKGGSFMTTKEALRCSNRLLDSPILVHPDTGFRCVRD